MIAVSAPEVTPFSATKVTTPVDEFNVNVPSPAIAMTPSASHALVKGSNKHVAEVTKAGPSTVPMCARPPAPVIVVKVAVPPGSTAFTSALADGGGGPETVGVYVADTVRAVGARLSETWYVAAAGVPTNGVPVHAAEYATPEMVRSPATSLHGVNVSSPVDAFTV